MRIPKDDGEFVAAIPRYQILLTAVVADELPGQAKNFVARVVPERIVERLEVIDIEKKERHVEMLPRRPREDPGLTSAAGHNPRPSHEWNLHQ